MGRSLGRELGTCWGGGVGRNREDVQDDDDGDSSCDAHMMDRWMGRRRCGSGRVWLRCEL